MIVQFCYKLDFVSLKRVTWSFNKKDKLNFHNLYIFSWMITPLSVIE